MPGVKNALISILPENVEPLKLFDACQTCWRYSFNGKVLGLDYTQVSVVMDKFGFKNEVFKQLQVMELAVVTHQK